MTPHRVPDLRITQRTKADARRVMRACERAALGRVLAGADPDAVVWIVPREAGNRRAHD